MSKIVLSFLKEVSYAHLGQSGVTFSSMFCFVGVRSAQSLTAKANTPLMFRSRSPVNQISLRSHSDIKCLQ